ncbi:hypothetical protein CCH79_00013943 [Gambusia affinis]|uniref:Fibronectin type-III domain-containing protein n=1 Tax=Gambusia affinis TaxID=33528 RepID=A0A315W295_GAMAF|nr:hypothetical protein CCH79_00013943 [Gambusia affinis]
MLTNGAFTALILICGHLSDAGFLSSCVTETLKISEPVAVICHLKAFRSWMQYKVLLSDRMISGSFAFEYGSILMFPEVPPPSNVIVKCKNLNTIVSWDYSKDQPQTIFWVKITGKRAAGSFEANTTAHQYDLTQFVWSSKERYLLFLVVDVIAVQGGKQSEAVRSKSFSFNCLESVDIKCSLEFPPVKVHKTTKGASVTFKNPLDFYVELKNTLAHNSEAELFYYVSPSENDSCRASPCKLDVTEECVTLKGYLLFGKHSDKQIDFKETKEYCSEKQGKEFDGLVMFAIILGSIFLIIIIVAVAVIFKVEAWTMKIPMPKITMDSHGNGTQQSFFTLPVNPENSRVSIVSPPVETTSLVSEDENLCEQPEPNDGGGDYDCRAEGNYADGGCLEESNQNLDGFVSGANGTDDDSPDCSMKTECVSLSSVEEERLPYDRPHVHNQRDLGDGEPVIGYVTQILHRSDNRKLFSVSLKRGTCPLETPPGETFVQNASGFLTFRSSLMACFLALLSSVLSSLFRACVDARGRSESLILVIRSACLAVRPLEGRTSRGMPVLPDTRIAFGCRQTTIILDDFLQAGAVRFDEALQLGVVQSPDLIVIKLFIKLKNKNAGS